MIKRNWKTKHILTSGDVAYFLVNKKLTLSSKTEIEFAGSLSSVKQTLKELYGVKSW